MYLYRISDFLLFLGPRTYPVVSAPQFHADSRHGYAKPSHMSLKIQFSVFPICWSNAIHKFHHI